MPANGPLFHQDAFFLDKAGHILKSWYFDFRTPACRTPITTLIKAGEKQFAPEVLGTIRISKPEKFRNHGETLIDDPNEARFSKVTSYSEQIDDPDDLAEAHVRDEEANRAAEIAGSRGNRKTTGIRKTQKRTSTLTYDKHGWIFCMAAAPTHQGEAEKFRRAMKPEYKHTYSILDPTAFALALSAMVAGQLGPRGNEARLDSKFGDVADTTFHKSQTVFHGPVIYTEDPYTLIAGASSRLEELLLPMFTKGIDHQDQREYRFVIFSEDEPPEACVDIEVSSSMRVLMHEHENGLTSGFTPSGVAPIETAKCTQDDTEGRGHAPDAGVPAIKFMQPEEPDWLPDPLDLLNDPTFPVRPHLSGSDPSVDTQQLTDSVLLALRVVLRNVPDKYLAGVASAAFHAEPLLRSLCEEFLDPVQNVVMSDNRFMNIRLKVPDPQSKARIVVGPLGEAAIIIQGRTFESNARVDLRHFNSISPSTVRELSSVGVRARE